MDADRAAVAEENAALKAELAVARAKASEDAALIVQQTLRIAKLERQVYGQKSERSARLIDQLALTFEELEANATEDELAAEQAVAKTTMVVGFTRKRAERNTFPDHLPRERVVIDPPTACECCGGSRLRKLGEDVTRTLESVPRQWKVIETVREKFSCRDCEKISQAPAPFHVIPRGWAGPSLLAMLLYEKFGQHQPLNRQTERYALEGVPISLSTAADAVGACCGIGTAVASVGSPRHGSRTPPRRRHNCARAGLGQVRCRSMLGLCEGRPPVRRLRSASGNVLLLARSKGRASAGASGQL